ncbi:trypsin-like serine peptidase [Jatrophihabitans fulvus]
MTQVVCRGVLRSAALVGVLALAACSGADHPGHRPARASASPVATSSAAARVATSPGSPGSSSAPPIGSGTPTATSAAPTGTSEFPTVGLVYNSSGRRCTGSVVDSSSGDTVLTAAHCATGDPTTLRFAPGHVDGRNPDGVWAVTAAYVPQQWQSGNQDDADVAVLTIASRSDDGRTETLAEAVGSEQVGDAPTSGEVVTAVAYVHGSDAPRSCRTSVYLDRGVPTFDCHGFTGGSSGSPWLTGTAGALTVRGVIGGLDLGGCEEYTSHTTLFTEDVRELVRRADDGSDPDDVRHSEPAC